MDLSYVEESVFNKYKSQHESQHENQDHPNLTERYVMERYVMENVTTGIPPPDLVVSEKIPYAAIENTHNNPEFEPP